MREQNNSNSCTRMSLPYMHPQRITHLPRRRQPRRRRPDLRQLRQRVQLALVLRQVRCVGVWAVHRGRALVDRCVRCGADLEARELVVSDLDSIPRAAVARCDLLARLGGKSGQYE